MCLNVIKFNISQIYNSDKCFINAYVVFGKYIEKFTNKLFNYYKYDNKINI